MTAPALSDLYVDGETAAGAAESNEVLWKWLDHIDGIISQSIEASE